MCYGDKRLYAAQEPKNLKGLILNSISWYNNTTLQREIPKLF